MAINDEASCAGLRAAAIEDDGSCDVDALLCGVADGLRAAGLRVRGLLMTYPQGRDSCACAMVLRDLDTARTYPVSQPLGSGSNACRADAQGFAHASEVLRRALDEAPDLVISNQFGGLEAGGAGFRDELLALMARDLPLLTAVATRYRSAWSAFTGGATVLAPRADAVQAWLQQTLGPTAGAGGVAAG